MAKTPLSIKITPEIDGRSALDRLVEQVAIIGLLGEVAEEVWSARAKHGLQHDLPLGFDGPTGSLMADLDGAGEFYHSSPNDRLEQLSKTLTGKHTTWRNILAEEFFETVAAEDWEAVRAEAIQTAAMAVALVAAGDAQVKKHGHTL